MPIFNIIKRLFLFAIIGAISLVIYVYFSTQNPKSGIIKLDGLNGKVIISRDQAGIPHIHAFKSDQDVFFALGFAHAQDRFWQMEFQRRAAAGRLSEVLGKAALDKDKFLRTWGFYRAAQSAWPAFDQRTRSVLHSYTQGVNAFLATGALPLQFKLLRYKPEPWTDIDSFSWSKMIAFDLQDTWKQKINNYQIKKLLGEKEIAVLSPAYPKNAPTILSRMNLEQAHLLTTENSRLDTAAIAKELDHIQTTIEKAREFLGFHSFSDQGSNNWVISGRLTQSGKPLLANDPHLSFSAPSPWYLVELQGPHMHITGVTVPGNPVVIMGHNNRIAWGITNVDPDVQDLYIEPSNTPLKIIHEIIKVKGEPDVDLQVKISNEGPIISGVTDTEQIGPLIAIKWIGLLPNDTTMQSFLKVNFAQNWQEFTDALRDFVTPSPNFIYADQENNIGYYLPGHIPIRNGWNGSLPVMADQDHQWAGYIPFEKLPHVLNPPEGFIASANNKPVPDEYPYSLNFRWKVPPYRIQRIVDFIRTGQPHSIKTCEALQMDTNNYFWRDLKPILMKTKALDKNSEEGLHLLKIWDGSTDLNSQAASIFNFWFRELARMPIKALTTDGYWKEPLFVKQQLESNGHYCRLKGDQDCGRYLSETLQNAMTALIESQGKNPNNWAWGAIHHAYFKEFALGSVKSIGWIWNRSIATPGDWYTVNVGAYDFATFDHFQGATYRQIVDLSDFDKSEFIYPLGQVDDPFDKHFADFLPLWRDGHYIHVSNNPSDWGKTERLFLERR